MRWGAVRGTSTERLVIQAQSYHSLWLHFNTYLLSIVEGEFHGKQDSVSILRDLCFRETYS